MHNKILFISAKIMMATIILVSTISCSQNKITMEQIISANSLKSLLNNHTSFTETTDTGLICYGDAEILFIGDDFNQEIYSPEISYIHEKDSPNPYMGLLLIGQGEWLNPNDIYSVFTFNYDITAHEEIKSIKRDGKIIYVETILSAENMKKYANRIDPNYEEGNYGINKYELDSKNLEILKIEEKIYHKDGSETEYARTSIIQFNMPKPENALSLMNYISNIEETRKITLIAKYENGEEKTFSTDIAKGDFCKLSWIDANESWEFYSDPDCTILLADSNIDRNTDTIVYAK